MTLEIQKVTYKIGRRNYLRTHKNFSKFKYNVSNKNILSLYSDDKNKKIKKYFLKIEPAIRGALFLRILQAVPCRHSAQIKK